MSSISNLISELTEAGVSVLEAEPMAKHTSFRIGGAADALAAVQNEEQLSLALRCANANGVDITVLGNGSNVLVSDEGIRGLVIKLDGDFCSLERSGDNGIVCGAGTLLSHLCQFALGNSLSGLEFAYGIPGTLGGAVFMNAGAYGGEMKDVLRSVSYVTLSGERGSFSANELDLGYRHSVFSGGGYVICSAELSLVSGDKAQIKEKMNELLQRRRDKQPLELPSAGSVFKRPEGYFAGALIEQCGLKGASRAGAMVSEKHAGFIVNTGGATCKDVLELVEYIQQTVLERTGVSLECEIRKIGV